MAALTDDAEILLQTVIAIEERYSSLGPSGGYYKCPSCCRKQSLLALEDGGDDDGPIVRCSAGCSLDEIRRALGFDGPSGVKQPKSNPAGATGPNYRAASTTIDNRYPWEKDGGGKENVYNWRTVEQDGHFMRPTTEFYEDEYLTENDKVIFMALSYIQSKRAVGTLVCWPTVDEISEVTALIPGGFPKEEGKLSPRQVKTSLEHLIRYGWIDVVPWKENAIGFKDSNLYVLHPFNGQYNISQLSNFRGGGKMDAGRPINLGVERLNLPMERVTL